MKRNTGQILFGTIMICFMVLLFGCTKKTEDGFIYKSQKDGLHIIGYEGNEKEVLIPSVINEKQVVAVESESFGDGPLGIVVPESVAIMDGAFVNCSTLRYIIGETEGNVPGYKIGQDVGVGSLSKVIVHTDGTLYGITTDEKAVILHIASDAVNVVVPEAIDNYPVEYMVQEALDKATSLKSLTLNENMLFPAELFSVLSKVEDLILPENSLSQDWYLSLSVVNEINLIRKENGISEMETDAKIVKAMRGAALVVDAGRVLDRYNIPFELVEYYVCEAVQGEELTSIIREQSEMFHGAIYEKIGIKKEDGKFHVYVLTESDTYLKDMDGLVYERKGDTLCVTYFGGEGGVFIPESVEDLPVTEIMSGAFKDHTGLEYAYISKSVVEIGQNIFEGCSNLRYVLLEEGMEELKEIPEQCVQAIEGEDTGDGTLEFLDIWAGAVYAYTSEGRYVVYGMPRGVSEWTVPEKVDDTRVVYVSGKAFINRDCVETLYLSKYCTYDVTVAQLQDAVEVVVPEDSTFAASTVMTAAAMEIINEQRRENDLEEIDISLGLVVAGMIRAEELDELMDNTRPDGREWISILYDENIYFSYAKGGYLGVFVGYGDVETELRKLMDYFTWPEEQNGKEYLYSEIGVGVYYGQYQGYDVIWMYVLGCISPEG